MNINETGLTARAFRFSRNVWGDFGGRRYYGERRSDLCTVIRSIFVLMPLAYAVNAGVLAFAVYAVGTLLLLLWLHLSALLALFAVILGVTTAMALLFGAGFGGEFIFRHISQSEPARVAVAFYRAKKASICPTVEIRP